MLQKLNFKKLETVRGQILKVWSEFNLRVEKVLNVLDKEVSKKSGPDRKFLFYYTAWFLLLFYFTFSFLADKNPFGLLIPFNLYTYTGQDEREKTPVYVSDGEKNVYKVSRRILLKEKTGIEKVATLIGEVGTPPFYETLDKDNENEFHATLLRLPDLRNAVIAVWFHGDRLIIDLDRSEMQTAFDGIKIRKAMAKWNAVSADNAEENRKNVKEQELLMKSMIFESVFMAIEKTLFDNFSNIQFLEFKLNGVKSDMPGLPWSLTETRKRG